MNIRWLHSQQILVVSLVAAALTVGVLTSLVIRQQRGQSDGQIYLETGGTVSAKPVVPSLGDLQWWGETSVVRARPSRQRLVRKTGRMTGAVSRCHAPAVVPRRQP